ncbi:hypothetical protein [Aquicoccus sp.]|uniref:hypothetical protein n=1 Tax=Aquicoccus sp. TaxID=2055851 RepID=UPI003565408C
MTRKTQTEPTRRLRCAAVYTRKSSEEGLDMDFNRPQLFVHAFLGIDITVDRFLADAQLCAFIDHAVADLLGRPALFDPGDHGLAQLRMSDQLALHRSSLVRLQLGGMTEVSRI